MPLPIEPGVQEVCESEERGHAKTRYAAGGNRETDEPRFVAPDEPAHIQGNADYKLKFRNCALLRAARWLSFRFISYFERVRLLRECWRKQADVRKHCMRAGAPL
jgi:hypothetical protein